MFLILKIIAVELVAGISLNYDISDPTKSHDAHFNLFDIHGKLT